MKQDLDRKIQSEHLQRGVIQLEMIAENYSSYLNSHFSVDLYSETQETYTIKLSLYTYVQHSLDNRKAREITTASQFSSLASESRIQILFSYHSI